MASPMTVRLDEFLREELRKEAERRGMTVSDLIRQYIAAGLYWSAASRGEGQPPASAD